MNTKTEKKTCTLVARCTKEEKDLISKKAKSAKKSESKYIIDSCIAGNERRTDKLRKMQIMSIQLQEELNQLDYIMEQYDSEISSEAKKQLKEIITEMGGVLRCHYLETWVNGITTITKN